MPSLAVWIGAKDLLGISSSWEEAANRLRTFTLREVLEVSGRISAAMHNAGPDVKSELEICALLFSVESFAHIDQQLRSASEALSQQGSMTSDFVLFSNRSLLALVQIAVNVSDSESDHMSGGPYQRLGEAMLIVNDLLAASSFEPTEDELLTRDGMRKWIHYLSVLAPESGHDPSVHIIARAADLFLSTNENLTKDVDYVDLSALFLEATGLSLEAYSLAFLALVGRLYGIFPAMISTESVSIDRKFFASETLNFTEAEVEAFLSLGGLSSQEFLETAKKTYSPGRILPFQYIVFERSPLVNYSNFSVCLSLPLLEQKLTMGLYHVLLNARPGESKRKARDGFQRFMGRIFEQYVSRTMQRIAKVESKRVRPARKRGLPLVRWIPEEDIQRELSGLPEQTPPSSDGILVVGSSLLVVESKAKMFSLPMRTGEEVDTFFARLDELVVDGAKQLDAMISHVRTGKLRALGIDARFVHEIFPIVVSLQGIAMNRLLRDWIDLRLYEEHHLQYRKIGHCEIHPLELFDVSDLEYLELVIESSGRAANMMLRRKQRDVLGRVSSLLDWGRLRGEGPQSAKDRIQYHSAKYRSMMDGALSFFRAHAKARGGSE